MTSTVINGVDYGPIAPLVGTWEGNQGTDIAPEPDGVEENPFYETITFEAIGDVTNAEEQNLAAIRYQQIVRRKSDHEVFHDQTGYWLWDGAAQAVMQSLSIPRGVTLLAGGGATVDGQRIELKVHAALDDPDWGIVQSPFMRDKAKTVSFTHELTLQGDELNYFETTLVDIYGNPRFEHTDGNRLVRKK